jgi:hypothetical protein
MKMREWKSALSMMQTRKLKMNGNNGRYKGTTVNVVQEQKTNLDVSDRDMEGIRDLNKLQKTYHVSGNLQTLFRASLLYAQHYGCIDERKKNE